MASTMLKRFLHQFVHPDTLKPQTPAPEDRSKLPTEALLLICISLKDIKDSIRFGSVCRSWRKVLRLCRKTLPPQPPMLLLENTHWYVRSFMEFSTTISNDHVHESNLPVSKYKSQKCYGSTLGWLLTKGSSGGYHLVNPFLSTHHNINLPLLPEPYIKKVVLSRNPKDTSDYIVMVCCGHEQLYMFKPGFKSWSLIYYSDDEWSSFQDIIYYKDQLYAVTPTGKVVSFNVNSSTQPVATTVSSAWYDHSEANAHWHMYLVELWGELICVVREFVNYTYSLKRLTVGFRIFKLVEENWVELNDLSGHALFLGKNSSMSLKLWENCKFMANRIYFTEANRVYFEYPEESLEAPDKKSLEAPDKKSSEAPDQKGLDKKSSEAPDKISLEEPDRPDMGVFNVEDGSMKRPIWENFPGMNMYPIWVQPTLNMKDMDQETSQ